MIVSSIVKSYVRAGPSPLEHTTLLPFLHSTHTIRRCYASESFEDRFLKKRSDNLPNDRRDTRHRRDDDATRLKSDLLYRSLNLNQPKEDSHESGRHRRPSEFRNTSEAARAARVDHVPFEKRSHDVKAAEDDILKGTTITPSERKAFETLFRLQKAKTAKEAKQKPEKVQLKDDQRARATPDFPSALQPLAEKARAETASLHEQDRAQNIKNPFVKSELPTLDKAAASDLARVGTLMQDAQTDEDLWRILHAHVLDRVKALELDGPASPPPKTPTLGMKGSKSKKSPGPTLESLPHGPILNGIADLQILTQTLPTHLENAMTQIISSFRGSQLPLSVLPTLKRLGPSAFALGASSQLYNQHMGVLFTKYLDLPGIVDVLGEMDREVYDFNEKTYSLLEGILKQADRAASGARGPGTKAVWTTDRMQQAVQQLEGWLEVIEGRLQAKALQSAREQDEAQPDWATE